MLTAEFDYELPPELIAQTPLEPRDSSRLMRIDRATGEITHHHFYDLPMLLAPDDLLVMNESRVIPARLIGKKTTGGKVEVLLLRKDSERTWIALVGGRRVRDIVFDLADAGELRATVEDIAPNEQSRRVIFDRAIEPLLDQLGHVPLPPYIHLTQSRAAQFAERYQTIYARALGSAAAPTAGLHFTHRLLGELRARGVQTASVTLHVGLDTFKPVEAEKIEDHVIHSEWCELPMLTATHIKKTREQGGRIVAVGTTSARTLETARGAHYAGDTRIFITPGYQFNTVGAMITNFHLPRSTLLAMIGAFMGMSLMRRAYATAIAERYRFYSFGDAMLIV
jgi:S-adenosylmethionine:tRNA ribosyltransferase-isomerase